MTDTEVITRLKQGDEKALKTIFDKFHIGLMVKGREFIHNYAEIEDMIAELYIKLWYRREKFDHILAIRSYLYVGVINACLSYIKRAKTYGQIQGEISYASEGFITPKMLEYDPDLVEEMWKRVEYLAPLRRRVFELIYRQHMKPRDIAKELNISVTTVGVCKMKAIQHLRKLVYTEMS
jgi:RNA polymerase sigma factor (sigma-70 family)